MAWLYKDDPITVSYRFDQGGLALSLVGILAVAHQVASRTITQPLFFIGAGCVVNTALFARNMYYREYADNRGVPLYLSATGGAAIVTSLAYAGLCLTAPTSTSVPASCYRLALGVSAVGFVGRALSCRVYQGYGPLENMACILAHSFKDGVHCVSMFGWCYWVQKCTSSALGYSQSADMQFCVAALLGMLTALILRQYQPEWIQEKPAQVISRE